MTKKEQFIEKVAQYIKAGGYTETESGSYVVAEEIYRQVENLIITDEVAESVEERK